MRQDICAVDTLNYLAYGSNLWPARLAARIDIVATRGAVRLPDRQLAFTKRGADGSGKCHLRVAPGAVAWGVVYCIARAARARLDRIEGVGHGYEVETLELPGHGPCFVYRAAPAAIDAQLLPFDWYHAYVLAGARHHALPASYLAAIAARATQRDADSARRAEHYACLGVTSPT